MAELHSYSFRPAPVFHKSPKEQQMPKLLIGFELETEVMRNKQHLGGQHKVVGIVEDSGLPLYCKTDGSLRHYMGVEIVSHPMSAQLLYDSKKAIKKMLVAMRKEAGTRAKRTCGFHMHLSADAFTGLHLFKFMKLIYENPMRMEQITDRTRSSLNQWASCRDLGRRDMARVAKSKRSYGRYTAVNLTGQTVELRAFRSCNTVGQFFRRIEFALAAFAYTKQAGISEVKWAGFRAFVLQNKKQYVDLAEYFTNVEPSKPTDQRVVA